MDRKYTLTEINKILNDLTDRHDKVKKNIYEQLKIVDDSEKTINSLIEELNNIEDVYKKFGKLYVKYTKTIKEDEQ
jgi:transcriptional accessory protein Tex/SPT6